jgi:predicted cobalt transporter CbtA
MGTRSRALDRPTPGIPAMDDAAVSALAAAWTTTMIATTLFLTILAFARVWDSAVYLHALPAALGLGP